MVHQLGGWAASSFRIIEDVEALRACRFAGEGCPLGSSQIFRWGKWFRQLGDSLGPKNAENHNWGNIPVKLQIKSLDGPLFRSPEALFWASKFIIGNGFF